MHYYTTKKILLLLLCIALMLACNNAKNKAGKHFKMGDSSLIITERDSSYLGNIVRDLAEVNGVKRNTIDEALKDVDSTQKSIQLQKAANKAPDDITTTINGVVIPANGFSVKIEGAVVKSGSRYIFQTGRVEENMTCKVLGLTNCSIEQRTTSSLQLQLESGTKPISAVGTSTTDWQALPGKDCSFITHSSVNMKFKEISAEKMLNYAKPIINNSGLSKQKQQALLKELKSASSTSSPLYQSVPKSTELRVSGLNTNGKKVNTIIKISL